MASLIHVIVRSMDGASVKVAVPEHGGLLALDTEGAVFASVRVAFLTKNEQLQNERVQIVELLQPRFFLRDNEEEIEDDQLLSHLSHDHITEEYVDHAMSKMAPPHGERMGERKWVCTR